MRTTSGTTSAETAAGDGGKREKRGHRGLSAASGTPAARDRGDPLSVGEGSIGEGNRQTEDAYGDVEPTANQRSGGTTTGTTSRRPRRRSPLPRFPAAAMDRRVRLIVSIASLFPIQSVFFRAAVAGMAPPRGRDGGRRKRGRRRSVSLPVWRTKRATLTVAPCRRQPETRG